MTVLLIVAALVAWAAAALAVAITVGRVVARRDQQIPTDSRQEAPTP